MAFIFYWTWKVNDYVQDIVMWLSAYLAAINCLPSVSMEEGRFIYFVRQLNII